MVLLGGRSGGCGSCGCGCVALQDRPVDGQMALDKGFLEDRREAKALCVARVCAVPKQGEPFVLGGTGLGEQVAEELLGRGADLLCSFGEAENGGREPPRRGSCPCASLWVAL